MWRITSICMYVAITLKMKNPFKNSLWKFLLKIISKNSFTIQILRKLFSCSEIPAITITHDSEFMTLLSSQAHYLPCTKRAYNRLNRKTLINKILIAVIIQIRGRAFISSLPTTLDNPSKLKFPARRLTCSSRFNSLQTKTSCTFSPVSAHKFLLRAEKCF